MKNKRIFVALLVPAVMLISSTSAFAETVDTTTQTNVTVSQTPTTAAPTDTTTTTEQTTVTPRAIDQKLADAIAGAYSITVTAQEIADLHATDVGYGEISKAYGFASLSGTTVSDVLGMKETMGWGEIAASLGFKVSDVTKSDKAKQNALNKSTEGDATTSQEGTTSHSNNAKSNGNNGKGNAGGNGGGNGGGKH